jgi:predicted RNase H-like HicB family nuclease
MRKIECIVERTNTGFSAYAAKYPVYTVGSNLEEIKANLLEALNLYFSDKDRLVEEKDIKISLDMPQFFEFYKEINVSAFSKRAGINQSLLSQYIKGIKKPSSSQIQRILKEVNKLGRELQDVGFLV